MALSDHDIDNLADDLHTAATTATPIPPITDRHDIDPMDAYRIARLNIDRAVEDGDQVLGHKVGLSAKAMQRMLGVNEPDFGTLLASMYHDDRSIVDISRLIQPRVEIEVAFVLKSALEGPHCTAADVFGAVDYLLPSIEIVDSRINDWNIRLGDTIADNASCGAFALGATPTRLDTIDIRLIGALLTKNGDLVETGCSGAVLGNPITAVSWLANKLHAAGTRLEAGEIILPGSCTAMVPVAHRDHVLAEFAGLGTVELTFINHPTT